MMLRFRPIISEITNACGPASLSMILQYHGLNISTKEVLEMHGGLKRVSIDELTGTYVIDNATIAAQLGFDVTVHSANGRILGIQDKFTNQYILSQTINKQLESSTGIEKEVLSRYAKAKNAGVNLMLMNPDVTEIKNCIQSATPIHLSISPRVLYQRDSISPNAGHSIVITGFTNNDYRFADPDSGKQYFVSDELLMSAIESYAVSHSAYLIIIKPTTRSKKTQISLVQ